MLYVKKSTGMHDEHAYTLIKDIYKIQGYQFSKQDFLKCNELRTLFTLHTNKDKDGDLIGTISLMKDKGGQSLPLSSIYLDEIEDLRQVYTSIYEVGNFVIDSRKINNRFSQESLLASRLLFKEVYQEAINMEVELLVMVINPKHLSFYKLIGFKEFGPTKLYPSVNAPAIPIKFDLRSCVLESNFFSRI